MGQALTSPDKLGRCLDHLLQVVEQEQHLALADVLRKTVLAPRVWAIVSVTSAGLAQRGQPDPEDARLVRGTSVAAASMASRVLPVPPGP